MSAAITSLAAAPCLCLQMCDSAKCLSCAAHMPTGSASLGKSKYNLLLHTETVLLLKIKMAAGTMPKSDLQNVCFQITATIMCGLHLLQQLRVKDRMCVFVCVL